MISGRASSSRLKLEALCLYDQKAEAANSLGTQLEVGWKLAYLALGTEEGEQDNEQQSSRLSLEAELLTRAYASCCYLLAPLLLLPCSTKVSRSESVFT